MSGAQKRREDIMARLKKEKRLKVADIKEMFDVSNVTVNNDLLYLEKKRLIQRQFGYASLKEDSLRNFDDTKIDNIEKKKELGRYAAQMLENNESVFFYTSSTIYQLASCLPQEIELVVVTNSTLIASELGSKPDVKIIMLGGFYNPRLFAVYGEQAVRQLKEYNIDKLFLSTNGFNAAEGATIDEPFEAELNKALIKNAKKVILLVDSTKIGLRRFISVAETSEIDILITNSDANEDEIKKIREKGTEVILV